MTTITIDRFDIELLASLQRAAILTSDKVFNRGSQAYARGRAKEGHCTD